MAGRDSQDIALPVEKPTSSLARVSQDIPLPVEKVTSSHARASQDLPLPVTLPTTALARVSQDVQLYMTIAPAPGAYASQDLALYIFPTPHANPNSRIPYYLSLLTSEYQLAPKIKAFLTAILTPIDDLDACYDTMNAAFDLDSAAGAQLDVLGQIVGVGRVLPFQPSGGANPTLDDGDYRLLIRAKIAQNEWDGTIESLYPIWQSLFPGGTIAILDNQNMTATIILAGSFTSITQDMITNGLIVPRPEGVLYTYTFAGLPIFGFDRNDAFIAGFDTGFFA